MKNHAIKANGIRQHYIEAGEGAPVVLLHGFPETNYAWRHQIPVLAQHYRVIAPDLRGYGKTDKPATGYDKRNMARDLLALLDHLGIDRIALVLQDEQDADVLIACPTMSIWGADFEAVGRTFDMAEVWKGMANNLRAEPIAQCGHLPQEEQPEIVNGLLLDFLNGWTGSNA